MPQSVIDFAYMNNQSAITPAYHQANPDSLAALPLWQRTLIARIQSGLPLEEARQMPGSNVSEYIIRRDYDADPQFARAFDLALAGRSPMSITEVRELARDYSAGMLTDAVAESRDKLNKPAARLGNRRLVLEAAGAIGKGSDNSGPTIDARQLSVNFFQATERYSPNQAPEPGPKPQSGTEAPKLDPKSP